LRLLRRRSHCLITACGVLLASGLGRAQTRATAATLPTKAIQSGHFVTHSSAAPSPSSSRRLIHKKPRHLAHNKKHGQQKIDSDRAREIQEALIREHYLDGDASGNWDAASQKAMERFQADQGWQTVVVPDSRALIKLGLGPDHEHLLNPQTAMTSLPEPVRPVAAAAGPREKAAPASTPAPSANPNTMEDDPPRSDH
jgi:Putative peptidoglycan binding domain